MVRWLGRISQSGALAVTPLARAAVFVERAMNDIFTQFVDGARITVIVRIPGKPEQDFMMTNDEPAQVSALIARRMSAGEDMLI